MSISGPRVAVAGWIGSTNLGDELIFAAIARKVVAAGATPTALTIDSAATAVRHGCETIEHRGPRDSLALWHQLRTPISALIFGGGGLLQSETSPWNLPFHLSRVWTGVTRKLPWAGIGLGVGVVDGPMAQLMTQRTLRTGIGVTVRDPGSAEALRLINAPAPVVAADPAISLETPDVETRARLAVSLRRLNRGGIGTAQSSMSAGPEEAWLASVARALDEVATATGLRVHFVALQTDRDDALHRAVGERMATDISFGATSPDGVLAEIAESQMVVAMRYHAAIAALLAGRPSVVIDYSPKMRYLAADVGGGMQTCAPTTIEGRRLGDLLRRAEDHLTTLPPALARLRRREKENERMIERLLEQA